MDFESRKLHGYATLPGLAALTLAVTSWLATPAQAVQIQQGFAGPYAPDNWTLNQGDGNGSVDPSGAPNSITITGSNDDNVKAINTDYTTTAVADGLVRFSWTFNSEDSPDDTFGYLLNGNFEELANESASGTAQFNVSAGNIFGFRAFTRDDSGFAGSATIGSFLAPVPGPLPIFGAAAAFGWSRRLRRRAGLARSSKRSNRD